MRRSSEAERASGKPHVEKVGLVTARSNNWAILASKTQARQRQSSSCARPVRPHSCMRAPDYKGLGRVPSSRPTASNYGVLDLDPFRHSSCIALASRMWVSVRSKWGHGDTKANPRGRGVSTPGPLKRGSPWAVLQKEGPGLVLAQAQSGATRTREGR